ncbi:MAG: hypothetical protein QF559_04030 [Candidatus Nitrosopelagicus sp.]|nr:hypothetical protein [Candidatus Nitrosopelagicus sp.]
MSVQVSYKKQITLGIFLIVTLLAGVEMIVIILDFFEQPLSNEINEVFQDFDEQTVKDIFYSDNLAYRYDKILLNEPNQQFPTLNINSYGFRGTEITIEKPENVYRIFFIGGSTSFGQIASSDAKTIPGILEAKFHENGIKEIEIVNAGINNANSRSETYLIRNIILEFDPNMLIIYDGWNEGQHDWGWNNEVEDQSTLSDLKNSFEISFNNFYITKIKPYYKTPEKFQELFKNKNDTPAEIQVLDSDLNEKKASVWQKRWQNICSIEDENDFKTIITLQPILGTGNKSLTPVEQERLESSFAEQSIILELFDKLATSLTELEKVCEKTIDLRDSFDHTDKPVFYDLGHTSNYGNELVAERIYQNVISIVQDDIKN